MAPPTRPADPLLASYILRVRQGPRGPVLELVDLRSGHTQRLASARAVLRWLAAARQGLR
jgi:hypothetical protein